jgi:hypothetical protein
MSRFSKPLTAHDVAKLNAKQRNELVSKRRVSDATMCKLEAEADELGLPNPDETPETSDVETPDTVIDIDEDFGVPDAPDTFDFESPTVEDESNLE